MKRLIWTCTLRPMILHCAGGYGHSFGGYGDRLKGIVTAKLLAERVGRAFYIQWCGTSNIKDCFECDCPVGPGFSGQCLTRIDQVVTDADCQRLVRQAEAMTAEDLYLTANQYDEPHARTFRKPLEETSRILSLCLGPWEIVQIGFVPHIQFWEFMRHNEGGVGQSDSFALAFGNPTKLVGFRTRVL